LHDSGARLPDVLELQFQLKVFFCRNDANFPDIRTGQGADQNHEAGQKIVEGPHYAARATPDGEASPVFKGVYLIAFAPCARVLG